MEDLKQITVRDLSGRRVKDKKVNGKTHVLSLENYREGVYFLDLYYSTGEHELIRIIKE